MFFFLKLNVKKGLEYHSVMTVTYYVKLNVKKGLECHSVITVTLRNPRSMLFFMFFRAASRLVSSSPRLLPRYFHRSCQYSRQFVFPVGRSRMFLFGNSEICRAHP